MQLLTPTDGPPPPEPPSLPLSLSLSGCVSVVCAAAAAAEYAGNLLNEEGYFKVCAQRSGGEVVTSGKLGQTSQLPLSSLSPLHVGWSHCLIRVFAR